MTTDPYEILGVPPEATLAEIEARYRLLLRQHHPDLHQVEGEAAVADAQARTQQLTWAMDVIRGKAPRGRAPRGRAAPGTGPTSGAAGPSWGAGGHGSSGSSDQWFGANPFWQPRGDQGAGAGPTDGAGQPGPSADDPPWAEYDWFGNRVDHGPDGPVPCPFCGRPFEDLVVYEQHLERMHHYRQVTVRRRKGHGRFMRAIGALRFVPAWIIVAVSFVAWVAFGFYAFLACYAFLGLVLWTQTTPRFRGRR